VTAFAVTAFFNYKGELVAATAYNPHVIATAVAIVFSFLCAAAGTGVALRTPVVATAAIGFLCTTAAIAKAVVA
jgi:hypothetical protein